MSYQTQSNALVVYKKQVALGTPATGDGGKVLRTAGGQGGSLTKAATESKEVRRDGMSSRGRQGTQKTTGSWDTELTVDAMIDGIEAVVRDTWEVADLTLDESDFTSITTGANSIVLASGDPRTLGISGGDVVRLADHASAGNNNRNIRVSSVDATTIHTVETLTVNATPDTDVSIIRPRKLSQFAGANLLHRYFTIDEYDIDIDQSEVMSDFVFGAFKLSMSPNGLLMCTVSGAGTGKFSALASGSSPQLTNPTESTTQAFSVVDATINIGAQAAGVDMVDLTSFDITCDIQPQAPDVFGSGSQKYAPDVFTGPMKVGINFTTLRKDLQYIQDLSAETVYSLHILAVDNMAEPKNFLSIYVGNFTLGTVQKSPLANQGGPRTVSIQVPSALVGKDNRGAGYDATMVKFQYFAA